MKTRFLVKDRDGAGSVSGWECWAHNVLIQRRQFATDGVRVFYQHKTSAPFVQVNERDLPANAREALASAMGKTITEWDQHMQDVERSQREGALTGLLGDD